MHDAFLFHQCNRGYSKISFSKVIKKTQKIREEFLEFLLCYSGVTGAAVAEKWQGKLKGGKGSSKVARETQNWQGKLKSGKGNSKVARETQKWQGKLKSGKGNSKVARLQNSFTGVIH